MVCFYLLGSPDRIQKDFSLPFLEANHIALDLGFPPAANSVTHDKKEIEGVIAFDVEYSIDEHCRRITPKYDSLSNEYALFFGCSITFGYGVNDTSTIPYSYQKAANSISYNYAANGWGMSNMLARFQREDLSLGVSEKDGVAIYIFFWDHIKRSIGSMDRFVEWVYPYPYFYLDDGKIVRDRTFKDGRYWTSKFYELVYNSSIVEYFKINFPNELRSDHFDLTSEMIAESKREYKSQFGNDNFYVVIIPSFDETDESEYDEFFDYLDEKGLEYIDLRDFIEYGPEYHLYGDPHPNAMYNEMISKEISRQIKKRRK